MKLRFDSPANLLESGYGGAWHNFAMCLLRRGVDVINSSNGCHPDMRIYVGQPYREWRKFWARNGEQVHGLFTMFESSILPPHWIEDINKGFDFIIVPSVWCKEIFKEDGVNKPIFVVPLGVDPHFFPKLERPLRKTFNIVWQGLYLKDRKGLGMIERALKELKLPNVRLIDKTVPFALLKRANWEFHDVNIHPEFKSWSICKKMSQAEMLMLLREADLSVNPTSGEGFGLIPLEHMATGLPTIISETSGCLDYRNSIYNIGIKCTEQKSWFGKDFGLMMRPDFGDLKEKINWAYENRDELKEIGGRASEWVHKEWTYEKATDRLLEVVGEFVS